MDKTRDVRRGGSSRFSRQKLLAGMNLLYSPLLFFLFPKPKPKQTSKQNPSFVVFFCVRSSSLRVFSVIRVFQIMPVFCFISFVFSYYFYFFEGLEKPKKERLVKKLSVVVNKAVISSFEDSEMGYHSNNLSDRENETPSQSQSSMSNATAKRFKLPKKVCLILLFFQFFNFNFLFI